MGQKPDKKKKKGRQDAPVEAAKEHLILFVPYVVIKEVEKEKPLPKERLTFNTVVRWLLRAINLTAALRQKHEIWNWMVQLWRHFF